MECCFGFYVVAALLLRILQRHMDCRHFEIILRSFCAERALKGRHRQSAPHGAEILAFDGGFRCLSGSLALVRDGSFCS
jgi:hypothetical protein